MKAPKTDRITRRAAKIVGQPVKLAVAATALDRPAPEDPSGLTARVDGVFRRIGGSANAIVVAILPDNKTAILEVNQANPGIARRVLAIHDGWPAPSDNPDHTSGNTDRPPTYRIGEWLFAPNGRRLDHLDAALNGETSDEPEAPSTGWAAVADAFVEEMTLPAEFLGPVKDGRTRVTKQCQRLLPDHYVGLGTPIRTMPTNGGKPVEAIIAFTDAGPWLLNASRGNTGLPRSVAGPIDEPTPVSLEPIEGGAGLLRLGEHRFRVPVAHVKTLRGLIIDMAAGPAEVSADEEPTTLSVGDESE